MAVKYFTTGAALIASLAFSFDASARPGFHPGGGFHHGGGHHPGVAPHPGFRPGHHYGPAGRPGWGHGGWHGGGWHGGGWHGGGWHGGGWHGGWRRPGYGWRPGGAIAAGAALGFLTAAAAASTAPAPGLCWYYTNPARTAGFWDYCP